MTLALGLQLASVLVIPAAFSARPIAACARRAHVPREPVTSFFALAVLARLACVLVAAPLLPSLDGEPFSSFDFDALTLASLLMTSRAALAAAQLDCGLRTATSIGAAARNARPALSVLLAFGLAFASTHACRLQAMVATQAESAAGRGLELAFCGLAAALLLAAGAFNGTRDTERLFAEPGAENALLVLADAIERGILVFLGVFVAISASGFAENPAAPVIAAISMLVFCGFFALLKLEPRGRSRYPYH